VDYAVGTSGVPATPSISYAYGTNIAQNNNGRLLKMTDGLGSETYSYDILGRVTQVSRAVTGVALPFNIGYGYNGADQLTSITYPSGRLVQQNYDVIGRLSSILSGTTTYLSVPSTGGYNSAQLPLALNYGSGVAGAFQYNDHLQMSSLSYGLNGTSLLNLSYNYLDAQGHNNGQIQGITDARGDAFSTLYSYDPLGRLIHAQTKDLTSANTWNLQWNYDIYGNRLSQSAGTPPGTLTTGAPALTIDPVTNHIAPGSGFNYDPAGNVIQDPSYSYAYNAEGELIKSVRTSDGMTATYAYDGHRWRMEKTSSGATTVYIYSGSKVLAEYAAGAAPSAPAKEYVYSGGSLLATLSGTSVTYHYPDHLSNRLETNAVGTQVRTFGHLPFGETWYETGTPDKWKFTGYERDASESGLDYAMNRMYSSGYGRFPTPDLLAGAIENPETLDRYSYSGSDPVNLIDPTGLNQVKLLAPPPDPCAGSVGCAQFGHDIFDALISFFSGADDGTFFGFDSGGNILWGFAPPSPFEWQLTVYDHGQVVDQRTFATWDQYADWRTTLAAEASEEQKELDASMLAMGGPGQPPPGADPSAIARKFATYGRPKVTPGPNLQPGPNTPPYQGPPTGITEEPPPNLPWWMQILRILDLKGDFLFWINTQPYQPPTIDCKKTPDQCYA
jgi:RHS repeat-associated protein